MSIKLDVSCLPDLLRLRIKQLRAGDLAVPVDCKPALREITA